MPAVLVELPRLLAVDALLAKVLSSESLEQGGIFLLENGSEALLHMDKSISPDMVQALLGIGSYDELLRVPQPLVLLPRQDPPSRVLQDLLIKVGGNEP